MLIIKNGNQGRRNFSRGGVVTLYRKCIKFAPKKGGGGRHVGDGWG